MPDDSNPAAPAHASQGGFPHIPFSPYTPRGTPEALARSLFDTLRLRRSVRFFADTPVSVETIRWCVATAGTAPSGANKQPWRFVAVRDPGIKRRIRTAAEAEEREFYSRRATPRWLADLAPIGTDADKPFLETAPWVIVVFRLVKDDPKPDGSQGQVYYSEESVGIACGLLIAAIHLAGLVTLTHTPSPMGFLSTVLARPAHERPFLLLPVGYPATGCTVPDLRRKNLDDILVIR